MSELACGVTLAFTVSPLPFPFLSFFELPLGTSAMSFCKKGEQVGSERRRQQLLLSGCSGVVAVLQQSQYRINPEGLHLVGSLLCDGQELLGVR